MRWISGATFATPMLTRGNLVRSRGGTQPLVGPSFSLNWRGSGRWLSLPQPQGATGLRIYIIGMAVQSRVWHVNQRSPPQGGGIHA